MGFVLSCLAYGLAQNPHLQLQTAEGQTILDLVLESSPFWIVRWNHSVTGVVVSDYYHWNGSQMLLTDTHTPAFDAGLGHIPERGRLVSDGFGGYFIVDIDEVVADNRYLLRVGSLQVNHRIEHAGQSYSLSQRAAGQRLSVQVVMGE